MFHKIESEWNRKSRESKALMVIDSVVPRLNERIAHFKNKLISCNNITFFFKYVYHLEECEQGGRNRNRYFIMYISLVLIERIDRTEIGARNLDLISRVNKVDQGVL